MKRPFNTTSHAFTLVELLLGLTISAVIVAAAATTYLAAAQSWDQGRSRSTTYQYARAAFNVIERHLRAAIPPDHERQIVFEGENLFIEGTELPADILRFSTTGGTVTPGRWQSMDLAEVAFFIHLDEETGEPSLMMHRRRFATVHEEEFPGETLELSPRVAAFDVQFWDGVEFIDEWYEEQLPEAVRVTLLLYDFDAEENPQVFHRTVALKRGGVQ